MTDPGEPLDCPTCDATPTSNGLLLTDRSVTEKRVCQALYDCPACGARVWRWNDRHDPLALWTDDYWPQPVQALPNKPRFLP